MLPASVPPRRYFPLNGFAGLRSSASTRIAPKDIDFHDLGGECKK
jgi:hypothetical protein